MSQSNSSLNVGLIESSTSTSDSNAKEKPKEEKPKEEKPKEKQRVKNIHSEMFKQYRTALFVPPKYNTDEITALFAEQDEIITEKKDTKK